MTTPRQVRLLRRHALGLLQRAPGTPVVVAIDGRSGSGKSTMAAQLAATSPAAVVSLESLYPGWDGLAVAPELLRRWVLAPLSAGHAARYRRFDWDSGRFGGWVEVGRPRLLIVEGVGAFDPRIAWPDQLRVWLEAPHAVRYDRAMARDGDLYRPHWDRWAAQERSYLDRVRPGRHAHLVFPTAG